jgi:hypothetical protein
LGCRDSFAPQLAAEPLRGIVLVDASFVAMRPALLGSRLPRRGFLGRFAGDFPGAGLKELWSLKGGVDADGVALVSVLCFGFLALCVVYSTIRGSLAG